MAPVLHQYMRNPAAGPSAHVLPAPSYSQAGQNRTTAGRTPSRLRPAPWSWGRRAAASLLLARRLSPPAARGEGAAAFEHARPPPSLPRGMRGDRGGGGAGAGLPLAGPAPHAMPAALGVDVGTQGTKAVLVAWGDGGGGARVLGRGSAAHAPPGAGRSGRAAEQAPAAWLEAAAEAAKQALREAGGGEAAARVVAVGVSGQQHGLVAMDAGGAVLRDAKLWCDTE